MEYLYDGVRNENDTDNSANFSEYQGFSIISPKKTEAKYEAVKGNFEEFSVSLTPVVEPIELPADIDAPSFGPELEALEHMQQAIHNRQVKDHVKPEIVEFNAYFTTKQSEEDLRIQREIQSRSGMRPTSAKPKQQPVSNKPVKHPDHVVVHIPPHSTKNAWQ